jgi:hypothetical protein
VVKGQLCREIGFGIYADLLRVIMGLEEPTD